MKNKDGIIISSSIEEAILVHELVGDLLFKETAHTPPRFSEPFSYKTEWYWVYKNKELSGSSGTNSLKHTIKTHPELTIYSVKQFKELFN